MLLNAPQPLMPLLSLGGAAWSAGGWDGVMTVAAVVLGLATVAALRLALVAPTFAPLPSGSV